jgi:hypothetical protein
VVVVNLWQYLLEASNVQQQIQLRHQFHSLQAEAEVEPGKDSYRQKSEEDSQIFQPMKHLFFPLHRL